MPKARALGQAIVLCLAAGVVAFGVTSWATNRNSQPMFNRDNRPATILSPQAAPKAQVNVPKPPPREIIVFSPRGKNPATSKSP